MSVAESRPAQPRAASRERTAWLVLLGAFAIFLVLAVSVPLAGNWYYRTSSIPQRASGQGTSGTTLGEQPNLPQGAVVKIDAGTTSPDLVEQTVLRTDGSSQMRVTFWDRSTLTLFPNSTVILRQMRLPRFRGSGTPGRILVQVSGGRARVEVNRSVAPAVEFVVQTPQAPGPDGGIALAPGSYAIETSSQRTHVSVRSGEAQVRGQTGGAVALAANQRAEIPLGEAAIGPLPAKRNLLANSDFLNPEVARPISDGLLAPGWTALSDQGGDGGMVNGTVEIVTTGTSRAIRFVRTGSNSNHGETGVTQPLDALVGDYLALALSFRVKIDAQSLNGGGEQSSEFPLMVRVNYRDANGNPQHWTHGFYCRNDVGYHVRDGTPIPCQAPFTFEQDIKAVLGDALRIESIRLYASGWDWDVTVSQIELIAE